MIRKTLKRSLPFMIGAALTVGSLGTVTSAVASITKPAAKTPAATYSTPIGRITEAQNKYLHTHPVLLHSYHSVIDIAYYRPSYQVNPPVFHVNGYFCAYSTGYGCLNNLNNGGLHHSIGYWEISGGKNGMWDQYYYGFVDSSWPWGTSYNLYKQYPSNGVYAYFFSPNGAWENLTMDQELGFNGSVTLEAQCNCQRQWWVWDGNGRWVGVYATLEQYNQGVGQSVYMGYTSAGVNNGDPTQLAPYSRSARFTYIGP